MKKKFPILTANFPTLIKEGGYYVDKTRYIIDLEKSYYRNFFFLRPRRFGKSLHISMLEHYYGIQHKDKFEELFGELFIGQPENVTPLRNSYYILRFDFSGISTQNIELIQEKFNSEIKRGIKDFFTKHQISDEPSVAAILKTDGAVEMFKSFISYFTGRIPDRKIYLLIDEYDHFTNELFSFNQGHFKEIVSRNGWVRKFYEVIKIYTGEGIIDRFFATGVTPVTLDSMTSGFNIAKNISLDLKYNEMAGFTETELRELVESSVYEEGKFDLEKLLMDLRAWYNGSRFSPEGGEKLYNPQLVISFLADFAENYTYPERMVDINVTSDYKKIANTLALISEEQRNAVVDSVLTTEKIHEGLTLQYNFERKFTKTDAVSLLYYNGLLTIEDSFTGLMTYCIPNYVVKQLYWEFFRALKEEEDHFNFDAAIAGFSFKEMSIEGKIDKLVSYAREVMNVISFRDLQNFSEKHLKMIFMTILAANEAYFVTSERETPEGYADLYLKRTKTNPGYFDHLIELKYVKQGNKSGIDKLRSEGIIQVTGYRDSLPAEERKNLKTWLVLFHDKNEVEVIAIP